MEIALWIVCSLLALMFVFAGGTKAFLPIKEVRKMPWAASFNDATIRLIGAAEVLGGLGLILPIATGVLPVLTPIAAACLAVLMAGATYTHRKINDPRSASVTTTTLLVASLVIAVASYLVFV
jgi:uncharacterized membrane protein